MKKHIVTLGGLPGSGKSTVRGLLAEKLEYESFSTGDFTRKLARERGMTLEEFNEVVAGDRELDVLIDKEQKRIEKEGDYMVIDAHLGFYFVPSSFKVFLNISIDEAARRIFEDRDKAVRKESGDTMETIEEAKERTLRRIENHKKRYLKHYGVHLYDVKNYDFVMNTEGTSPEEIANAIITAYTNWLDT